jgi:hypothetical protein
MFLPGCDLVEHRAYHDPVLKLQKEDYEKITQAPEAQKVEPVFHPKSSATVPALTPAMKNVLPPYNRSRFSFVVD